jgi:transposase
VSDEEWEFVALYLTLHPPDAPQRKHELREVFKAVRWLARRSRLALDYERLPETLVQGT